MSYSERAKKSKDKAKQIDESLASGTVDTDLAESSPKSEKRSPGRPRKEGLHRGPGAKQGLPDDKERFTMIAQSSDVKYLKDLAYTERITIGEALTEIVRSYRDTHADQELLERPTP